MKTYLLPVVSLATIGQLAFSNVSAQSTDSLLIQVALEEATVQGVDFVARKKLNSPKAVTVLEPSEWSTSASISEALEFVPGVDVQSRGAWGIQTDISIRGGSFEQVALRVNGMRWSAPHTGHHLMNIPMDPEDLGHVEVVRSGAGPWAGVGAFSGAINMETNSGADGNRATFTAELGSFDWQRLRGHVDWKTGQVTHHVSLSRASTLGHIENADATIERLYYGMDWARGNHRWKGLLAAESKAFGAQNFYTSVYPDQYEETGSAVAQLSWEMEKDRLRVQAGLHGRYHADRFELYREGAGWYNLTDDGFYVAQWFQPDTAGLYAPGASWYPGANQHRSFVTAANALAQWESAGWTFSAAADVRNEVIRSNRLGAVLEGENEADVYTRGDDRQNLDGYVSAHREGKGWDATLTYGVNANSRFGMFGLPAVQLTKSVGSNGRFFGSAGRSVRHPSFTDLYYNLGGAVGSENLQPEQSDQLEAGARWKLASPAKGAMFIESTRFFRRGTNLIDWVRFDGSDVFEATNLSAVDFWGGDIAIQYQQPSTDRIHIQHARVSSTWMDASRTSQGFTSNYVLDFVRLKYDALVRVAGKGPIAWTVRGSVQDRTGVALQWSDAALLQLWGAEISFRGGDGNQLSWKGHVRLDNAFDVQYADRGSVLQPGRMVRFGLTFEWKE